MVSKAKSIRGSVASIKYIQNDKEQGMAQELDRNGIMEQEPNKILQEFRDIQSCNQKCQNNTISLVISPSEEREFNMKELREITREHLKGLGLEKNQYLATVHKSTGKQHVHVVANRINLEGKAIPDNFISVKSQAISEKIAKNLGLKTAKEISQENKLYLTREKKQILSIHRECRSKVETYGQYKSLMESKGVKVMDSINKQGHLQGYRLQLSGSKNCYKASQIGKEVGMKNLIENSIKMPAMTPPYVKLALEIVKSLTKDYGIGLGY